jgi:cell division cycle 14
MSSAQERELASAVEILPGRLYWVSLSTAPATASHPSKSFFCIDSDLIYWNFFLDFGPLNLGHLYRYCALLNSKLSEPKLKDKVIYHYCANHPHKVSTLILCNIRASAQKPRTRLISHVYICYDQVNPSSVF